MNYADVKSERHRKRFIYKSVWRIFMHFFFLFLFFVSFVSESSVFKVKSLH